MEKGNAGDIKALADDLGFVKTTHPDALKNNPDIAKDLDTLIKKSQERYDKISNKHA